jgi:hypothetical protein
MVGTAVLPETELAPNEKWCSKCKEGKDRGEFPKDIRQKDGFNRYCFICTRLLNHIRYEKTLKTKGHDLIPCPICGRSFRVLFNHISQLHKLTKGQPGGVNLDNITVSITKESSINYSKSNSRQYPKLRLGDSVEIKNKHITFPKSFWPKDCKYVNVIVDKAKLQIKFNPTNIKAGSVKHLVNGELESDTQHRLRIHVHNELLEQLEIARPIFSLRKGAGFVIQFYQNDGELLDIFEFWSNSKHFLNTQSHLTTGLGQSRISIAEHIWPINAEHVFLEWNKSNRKNGQNYLDLLPVSRTGFIVGKSKLDFKQYVGLENCKKLWLQRKRFIFSLGVSPYKNLIPGGNWDLVKTLPSGALRFRLYKERQPKQQRSEEIAS